jgi:citronellol/citronellal dehydrogenase
VSLAGKTLFVSGASRGIGLAIALRAAREGANVIVAAKTVDPHPKLPGTIHTAAAEIEAAGGQALAVACDVRAEEQIAQAVAAGVDRFGGIDIVVNNASAIRLGGTLQVDAKAFDLMTAIGPRATYLVTRAALPHLEASAAAGRSPHILTLSPPIALDSHWVAQAPAYTFKKYGMTLLTLAFAAELRTKGVAANALWPRTTIATAAVQNLLGGEAMMRASRTPEIVADAAYAILTRDALSCTGNAYIDEDVLRAEGVTDLEKYSVVPGATLANDIFVDEPVTAG